jgi:TnpA family transposase
LERLIAAVRTRAERETFQRLEPVLDGPTRRALDALCVTDVRLGVSRLVWVGREATSAAPSQILEQLAKLAYLREVGAERWALEAVPANRRRQLAALARRSSTAALAGRPDQLRYPALLCFCQEQLTRLVDEVLDRSDQAIGEAHGRARHELQQLKADNATAANEKVALFDLLVGLLLDDTVADTELRERAWQQMPPARWAAARAQAREILRPLDDNHFEQLAGKYTHLRRFAPALLAALRFSGVPDSRPLLDAIELLRDLNASGPRVLPDTAPSAYVPAPWRPHVIAADGSLDRRQWELCLLSELRSALRAGAVWVAGSRRYQPADRYLITPAAWRARRDRARTLLGLPASADERLEQLSGDVDERVAALDRVLATGQVAVDSDDGDLHVRRLPGIERPEPTSALAAEIAWRLPDIDLADVLIDVDAWTHFSDELSHAHGATPRQPRLREHRYAALLAHACNLGYARMGQAARIDPQQLAWTTQWYLRPEALAAANARIVDAHHALPLAQHLGSGRFSSSDGKRHPVGVDSPEARAVGRYFGRGRGITFYVWTSDQHTHYATRVVRTTVRDATYMLDGILDNQTELPIEKHTTDTAGYSDLVFALFDLLGLQFAPRLAGLPERRLYHPRPALDTPAGRLLAHPLNLKLIRDGWDDLVRCAASLRDGTVTASLLIGRLQAAGAKLPLTRALQEYERLVKTRFVLGDLADETERRAIGRQLNKAEALHDRLFHGRHGTIRLHTPERQSTQAHCLHLAANAVIYWNTIYTQLALDELPHQPAEDELAGLTPTLYEHVNPLGTYTFDTDRPAGQLRPLRADSAA